MAEDFVNAFGQETAVTFPLFSDFIEKTCSVTLTERRKEELYAVLNLISKRSFQKDELVTPTLFESLIAIFGPIEMLVHNVTEVVANGFFFGELSSNECSKHLSEPGEFLFRIRKGLKAQICIAYVSEESELKHLLVTIKDHQFYIVSSASFDSFTKLVEAYTSRLRKPKYLDIVKEYGIATTELLDTPEQSKKALRSHIPTLLSSADILADRTPNQAHMTSNVSIPRLQSSSTEMDIQSFNDVSPPHKHPSMPAKIATSNENLNIPIQTTSTPPIISNSILPKSAIQPQQLAIHPKSTLQLQPTQPTTSAQSTQPLSLQQLQQLLKPPPFPPQQQSPQQTQQLPHNVKQTIIQQSKSPSQTLIQSKPRQDSQYKQQLPTVLSQPRPNQLPPQTFRQPNSQRLLVRSCTITEGHFAQENSISSLPLSHDDMSILNTRNFVNLSSAPYDDQNFLLENIDVNYVVEVPRVSYSGHVSESIYDFNATKWINQVLDNLDLFSDCLSKLPNIDSALFEKIKLVTFDLFSQFPDVGFTDMITLLENKISKQDLVTIVTVMTHVLTKILPI